MARQLILIFTGIFLVATGWANGNSRIKLSINGHLNSCGYFSSVNGTFKFIYMNPEILYGSKVFLNYGFGGREWKYDQQGASPVMFDWQDANRIELKATAPYTWEGEIAKQTNYRSSPRNFISIQFYFSIVRNQDETVYDKGNTSRLGFYNSEFYFPFNCQVQPQVDNLIFSNQPVVTVERN